MKLWYKGGFKVIIDALQSVLTIFLMTGVGFYFAKKQWFDEKTGKLFSKLVVKVSLPAFMLANLTTSFNKQSLSSAFTGIVAAFITMVISYITGYFVAKLLKVPGNRRGLFSALFGLSNTIFVGLPVNNALFGVESTQYVLLYYITNTFFFWTFGVYGIKKDSGKINSSFFSKESLKNIITPPIITFFVSVTLVMLGVKLPKFLLSACTYIGNLTTPLSIFFIGITLSNLSIKDLKFDKENIAVIIGRFILSPLIIFLLLRNMNMPLLMKKVFILEAAMPAMTQAAIVTEAYGGDYKSAAVTCTLTTALSLVVIPIYMILFAMFLA